MTDDRRAHDRISALETQFNGHLSDHKRFEDSIIENTRITRQIAENTTEIVELVKGAKFMRQMLMWMAPIIVACASLWAWIKTH